MQYLLALHSYRKYFILISLKERKNLPVLFDGAVPGLTWLSLFYFILQKGKVCLRSDLKNRMMLTFCLNL